MALQLHVGLLLKPRVVQVWRRGQRHAAVLLKLTTTHRWIQSLDTLNIIIMLSKKYY